MDADIQTAVAALAAGRTVAAGHRLTAALEDLGLAYVRDDAGVRLDQPLELLDAARIEAVLAPATKRQLARLDIFWDVDSTNTWLLGRSADADFHAGVCLAERQLAGKGRRGRHWVSPFGKNIYMSLGWRMATDRIGVGGLSLVVGMQVVAVLRELGIERIGLKWPNDVLKSGGKLAGILVEVAPSPRGEARLVIGIGINLRLDAKDAEMIDQRFSTVSDQMAVSRNLLVSRLLDALVGELGRFQQTGFAPYAAQWHAYNLYDGLRVQVNLATGSAQGIDRGVDEGGNLLLETGQGIQSFNAGEVSLRPMD